MAEDSTKTHFNEGVYYIAEITLDEATVAKRTPEIEHEKKVAIFDLLQKNSFAPADEVEDFKGPYHLHISVSEGKRLVLEIYHAESQKNLYNVILALSPFRKIIRDYFQVCESYFDSVKHLSPNQIETIDMARRGIHDEGAELLEQRLRGKIKLDIHTARRLFTLICVLHIKL